MTSLLGNENPITTLQPNARIIPTVTIITDISYTVTIITARSEQKTRSLYGYNVTNIREFNQL